MHFRSVGRYIRPTVFVLSVDISLKSPTILELYYSRSHTNEDGLAEEVFFIFQEASYPTKALLSIGRH